MSKEEIVKDYKNLTLVEQAFRNMKTTDEFIRPLRHWNVNRVKGACFYVYARIPCDMAISQMF